MPRLDVSSVLSDPLFQTRNLQCLRQAQTVGDDGIATNAPSSVTFSGVVTQNSGDTRQIRDDGSYIEGDITIHTRFRLTDGKDGRDADIIIYKGDQYTVVNVADWSDWGRGFICAQADLIPLSGGSNPDA
jgi:hypothetical protein